MVQHLIKKRLWGKSADARLDRAGSLGLGVGPPQIAPEIDKKRCRNPMRFRCSTFMETCCQSEPNGLPNGTQKVTQIVKLCTFFRDLIQRRFWGFLREAFGAFGDGLGRLLGGFWGGFGRCLRHNSRKGVIFLGTRLGKLFSLTFRSSLLISKAILANTSSPQSSRIPRERRLNSYRFLSQETGS